MARIALIAAVFAALATGAPEFAGSASARRAPEGTCALDPASGTLTVVARNSALTLRRRGAEIVVRDSASARQCSGGTPTVHDVDVIRMDASIGADVTLDLGGGPFAPGRTDEGDGSPEIEIVADLEYAGLRIEGTGAPDAIVAGRAHGSPALNLNARERKADPDLDISGSGPGLTVDGGAGGDRISGAGGHGFSRAYRSGMAVSGGPGADSIDTRNGVADTVDCGRGVDRVGHDRKDRLRACE
jgi:hypothetical protein